MALAEQLTPAMAEHGEGPVWSPSWGGLRWVDMLSGDVLALCDDGDVQRWHVADVVAAIRPRRTGGAVMAVERGFVIEDADGTLQPGAPLWDTGLGIRMNEGGCDPQGRFYCGSMAYSLEPGCGVLYRLDPDGAVKITLTGLTVSNGLDWSPDGRLAYYIDSATRRVDVFDFDPSGAFSARRPFVCFEPGAGDPDGLTVDAEGGVWVALWGAGAVRRYDPNGRLTDVVRVPATWVTACTFGGVALDRLYITTSRYAMSAPTDVDGALFVHEPGITGRPVRAFAG